MILLAALLIAVSSAADERSCSRGSARYLCENLRECSQYLQLDEGLKELCAVMEQGIEDDPPTRYGTGAVDDRFVFPTSSPTLETIRYTSPNFITTAQRSEESRTTQDIRTPIPSSTPEVPLETRERDPLSFGPVFPDYAYYDESSEGVKARITKGPRNVTVAKGDSVEMACSAEGNPTAGITLTKRENTNYPDITRLISHTADGISGNEILQKMTNVNEDNEGWYTCQACNFFGCDRAEAYLRLLDLCALPENQCKSPKVCKADPYTATTECVCPEFCEPSEMFKFLPSGGLCTNYCENKPNECFMKKQACEQGIDDIRALYMEQCVRDIPDPVPEGQSQYTEATSPVRTNLECQFEENVHITDFEWYRNDETEPFARGKESGVVTVDWETTDRFYCAAVKCNSQPSFRRLVAQITVIRPTTEPPTTTPQPTTPGLFEIQDAPRSTCAVFGDPHFGTYDGLEYDYMGRCDNVLAMDCERAEWFVYGRMRPCGVSGGTCLEAATLIVTGDIVEIQRGWLVNLGGRKVVPKNHVGEEMIITLRSRNFTLLFDGSTLTLSTVLGKFVDQNGVEVEDKVVLYWDGYVSLHVQSPESTRTCGMCGNNDGRPGNDMRTRRRGMTNDPFVFGESWRIGRRCQDGEEAPTPQEVCGERYDEVREECERVFATPKLAACAASTGLSQDVYVSGCVYDECEGLMGVDQLPAKCVAAQAYATTCAKGTWQRGDPLPFIYEDVVGWEEEVGCPSEEERFQPVLDTGCPQPSLEEELQGDFKWRF